MNEQRSEGWFKERGAKLTASRFGDVLAKETTIRYNTYLSEKVDEVLGVPSFKTDDQPWFRHGKMWEDEARASYVWKKSVETGDFGFSVVVPPFRVHDEYDFIGCSGDFLVGDDGGGEIKSHKSITEHEQTKKKGMPTKYRPQVQGCMWIEKRKWWDFVSYYRNDHENVRDTHIIRVFRDDEYIERLKDACLRFWIKVCDMAKNEIG